MLRIAATGLNPERLLHRLTGPNAIALGPAINSNVAQEQGSRFAKPEATRRPRLLKCSDTAEDGVRSLGLRSHFEMCGRVDLIRISSQTTLAICLDESLVL